MNVGALILKREIIVILEVVKFRRIEGDGLARFSWKPRPASEGVLLYRLQKSVDKGLTFTLVTTLDNDTESANYDADIGEFFYEDNDPQPGEILRVRAERGGYVGPWAFVFCPVNPPAMCLLYGSVVDSMSGQPLGKTSVIFSTLKPPEVSDAQMPSVSTNSLYALKTDVTRTTDVQGFISLKIIQGTVTKIHIPELGFTSVFRVPEADVLNITDIRQYELADFDTHEARR